MPQQTPRSESRLWLGRCHKQSGFVTQLRQSLTATRLQGLVATPATPQAVWVFGASRKTAELVRERCSALPQVIVRVDCRCGVPSFHNKNASGWLGPRALACFSPLVL